MRRAVLNLDVRKQEILKAVIHTFVYEAEPVGSERVAHRLRLRVSSATVRNEMAVLEDLGYLSHPHTSAGRVPTDRGYRLYVDLLLREDRLTPQERTELRGYLPAREERSRIAEAVARALAVVTDYASLVSAPAPEHQRFTGLHFIPLSSTQVMAVIVKGTANILKQPEFQDVRAAQPLLSALEQEEVLSDLLEASPDRDVWVTIGGEHRHEALRATSVVAAPYRMGGRAVGALGIVGPTRMKYGRAMSLVRYLAGTLSDILAESS